MKDTALSRTKMIYFKYNFNLSDIGNDRPKNELRLFVYSFNTELLNEHETENIDN